MDPVTVTKLTLSGISAFSTTVKICIEAYKAYKLSEDFGTDWVKVERRLFIQYTKFTTLSEAPIHWFSNNLWNPEDDLSVAVKMQLIDIQSHFKQCRDLMKKYEDQGKPTANVASEADQSRPQQLEPTIHSDKLQGELESKTSQGSENQRTRRPHALRKLVFWTRSKNKIESHANSSKSNEPETASTSILSTSSGHPRTEAPISKELVLYTSVSQTGTDDNLATTSQDGEIVPEFVTQELKEVSDQAAEKQSTAGKYNRIRWVHHDRENFLKAIDDIERCNTQLDSLLHLRSVSDPAAVLGATDRHHQDRIQKTKQIQGSLKRLHSALVNEDPERFSEDLVEINDKLPIYTSRSYVSALYAHLSGLQAEPSVLLYASTRHTRAEPDALPNAPDEIDNLRSKLHSLAESTERDEYEVLGTALSTGSPRDSHVLICHGSGPWYAIKSLKELLSNASYTKTLSLAQRLAVGRLMTLSFLYFGHLARTTDVYPRPENVLFYNLSQAARVDSDAVTTGNNSEVVSVDAATAQPEAQILNPYLAIGFGRKKQNVGGQPLGATSGLARRAVNPVAELGLVLFQVGTETAAEYGSGTEGFKRAVRQSRQCLHELVSTCGPGFAELVGLCLDRGDDLFAPATEADDRFMEGLRSWFRRKEETALE